MSKSFVVAIDGPSGAGKSTVAKMVAERCGFYYLDTGMMYRAVTAAILEKGISPNNIQKIIETVSLFDIKIEKDRVLIDNKDFIDKIRKEEVTAAVSAVSAVKEVREKLVMLQREFASGNKIVMDGRDIGTVVFPDAFCKIFLDASLEERAKRRLKDLGWSDDRLNEVMENLKKRDFLDSNRKESPLRKAEDAVIIDTTNLTKDEVVEKIIYIINQRLKGGGYA